VAVAGQRRRGVAVRKDDHIMVSGGFQARATATSSGDGVLAGLQRQSTTTGSHLRIVQTFPIASPFLFLPQLSSLPCRRKCDRPWVEGWWRLRPRQGEPRSKLVRFFALSFLSSPSSGRDLGRHTSWPE
jgi:hypothetical protein